MARSITEIKKGMTEQFMANPVIREKYGLKEDDTFDSAFSTVSIENILFGIFASAAYILEGLFDTFAASVDKKVAAAVPATIPWYRRICLEYQHGDKLVLNEATQQYGYEEVDLSKRLVKFAAVRDQGAYVDILVSGEGEDNMPVALPNDILVPFEQYLRAHKPAGIQMEINSYNPDDIRIYMSIQYDRLIMNDDGTLISNNGQHPVEDAIKSYLRSIEYGGVFNKTKLIDVVQKAEGVQDLILSSVSAKPSGDAPYTEVKSNNYPAVSGAFNAVDLRNTITYVTSL